MPLITPRRRFLITAPLALFLPAGLLTYLGLSLLQGVEDRYVDQVNNAVEEIIGSVRNRSNDNIQNILLQQFKYTFQTRILNSNLFDSIVSGEVKSVTIEEPFPYISEIFLYEPRSGIVFLSRAPGLEDAGVWTIMESYSPSFANRLTSDIEVEHETYTGYISIPELSAIDTINFMTYPDELYVPEEQRELVLYVWSENEKSEKRDQSNWFAYGFTFDFEYINNEFFPDLLDNMRQREPFADLRYPVEIEDRITGERIPSIRFEFGTPNTYTFRESDKHHARTFSDKFPWYFIHFSDITGEDIMEVAKYEKFVYYCLIAASNVIMIVGVFSALRNIARELEISEMRSDFVARVSHELRTPLGLIRLYAETLEMGRTRDEHTYKEYLRSILKESERLSHLINNILNFSQMEAETKHYALTRTNLEDVIYDVVDSMSYHMERHGFELVVEVSPDPPESILTPMRFSRRFITCYPTR